MKADIEKAARPWSVHWVATGRPVVWRLCWSTVVPRSACCPAAPGTSSPGTLESRWTTCPQRSTCAHRSRRVDVGAVTLDDDHEQVFLVMAGIGMVARMMAGADERINSAVGLLAYVLSGGQALFDPRSAIRASSREQQAMSRRARMVVVGNCGQLTGGLVMRTRGWTTVNLMSPCSPPGGSWFGPPCCTGWSPHGVVLIETCDASRPISSTSPLTVRFSANLTATPSGPDAKCPDADGATSRGTVMEP